MDYEGIGIYEKLAVLFEKHCTIRPFCEAYLKMLGKAEEVGIDSMPPMKAGQNQNIGELFWSFFDKQDAKKMQQLLQKGQYIPQEILAVRDFYLCKAELFTSNKERQKTKCSTNF